MNSILVPVGGLAPDQLQAMFALLDRHFVGVTWDGFCSDLANKQFVLLILDEMERLAGFSTIGLWETDHEGTPIAVLVSGDTIVSRAAWQRSSLPRAWLGALAAIRERARVPLYWLLLTSGFRTYRLLTHLTVAHYPRAGQETPPSTQRLLERLAQGRFGDEYVPEDGVVRLGRPQVLRQELLEIPDAKLRTADVEEFLLLNPGHARGDELVCIADLSDENLTPHGRRLLQRAGG